MVDFKSFMQEFAGRESLSKKVELRYVDTENRPRIYCDEPAIVARFWSHLRQEAGPGSGLLIRGQTGNHHGMAPGIFRPPTHNIPMARLIDAESAFESAVIDAFPDNRRFRRDNLGALLQHYGYRTSWLDLVDNLWTAVWFATHDIDQAAGCVSTKCVNSSGWLYFLMPGHDCSAIDIRELHHGLSLRPHAQAGWSMKGPADAVADLNRFVVATVEFPVDERWRLTGYLASEKFFFPSPHLDDTLGRLADQDIDGIASRVERDYGVPGAIGRLFPAKAAP
jgi:hypothetical protein